MNNCAEKDQNVILSENNIDGMNEWHNMTFCSMFWPISLLIPKIKPKNEIALKNL